MDSRSPGVQFTAAANYNQFCRPFASGAQGLPRLEHCVKAFTPVPKASYKCQYRTIIGPAELRTQPGTPLVIRWAKFLRINAKINDVNPVGRDSKPLYQIALGAVRVCDYYPCFVQSCSFLAQKASVWQIPFH